GLRGASAMSGAEARRRGGDGQPERAQGPGGARLDRSSRGGGALPAALFPRSESHREGLGQTQTIAPRGQGAKQRSARSGHYRGPAMHHSRQRKRLVWVRSQWSTVKQKMLWSSSRRERVGRSS